MNKISIAIPCYDKQGEGKEVLEYSFNQMKIQNFKDFEIIVSDDSENDNIKNLCEIWQSFLDIKYYKNQFKKGASSNTNHTISKCSSEIIKLLCQDDYLLNEDSLQIIYDHFDNNTNWLFTEYIHTRDRKQFYRWHIPFMSEHIELINTLGTPSGLTIRNNSNNPKFDENLKYYYDCVFYKEMFDIYGQPKIVPFITMVNFIWSNSITSNLSSEEYNQEINYVRRKYAK
jgi:glycosyltransferase involved in cell wall biosynthesis